MNNRIFNFKILLITMCILVTPILQCYDVEGWKGNLAKFVVCEGLEFLDEAYQPTIVKDIFLTDESGLYAYLLIDDYKIPLSISIEWVEPNGDIYKYIKFRSITNKSDEVIRFNFLDISKVTDKLGKWKVNAYVDEELASSTSFHLLLPFPVLEIVEIVQDPYMGLPTYIGNSIIIAYTLKNSGGVTGKQVEIKLDYLRPEDGLRVYNITRPKDLHPLSIETWILELIAENPGNYSIRTGLYINEQLEESWDLTFRITKPEIDLIDRILEPEMGMPIYPGDVVSITYVFENVGSSVAKQIGLDVQVPEGLEIVSLTPPKDIEVKKLWNYTIVIKTMEEGNFQINIQLNSYGYNIVGTRYLISVSPNLFLIQMILAIIIIATSSIIISIIFLKRKKIIGMIGKVSKSRTL
ncbi:MAG: hypothetical protein NWF08_06110 [Candidatus Bathyarchaeota archaeon]|nr:hypothetical protein [Candidatus Bathyarchaeota archaeon]